MALMSYLILSERSMPQVRDKVILFPIIANTWSEERSKFHVSPGTKVFPPLLALSSASFERCVSLLGECERPKFRKVFCTTMNFGDS